MRVVGQVTGLQYDPDFPDSSPNDGQYGMEGEIKDCKDSDGNTYSHYDYCRLIVHEKFPNNLGCAVLVSFGSAID